MKIRLLPAAFLIALFATSLVHAGDDDTQLGKEMSAMNRAFRQLKKQAADPALNAASLELVAKLKKATVDSMALIPEKAADLPEGDRAAFTEKYKKQMQEMVAAIDKLEAAFKAGDNDAAAKIVGEINAMQRAGHKEFRKPQD